jgi:hypothetical protein
MHAFLAREREIALRVLTTDRSCVQRNTVEATRALLQAEVDAKRLDAPMDVADLAYIVVRIGESFLYTDIIAGGRPDPDKARQAIQALLS